MKRLLFLLVLLISKATLGQQIDVQHYRYEIELSDASNAISGKASVQVKFNSPAAQFQLDLVSSDNEKGMQVFSVKEGNEILRTTHVNNILTIYLANAAKAGEVRNIEINYMGVPADGLIISKNKYGDRTFFADNWPDRAHNWIPCNDRPNDKASVEFLVSAPAHYRVIGNGLLQSEKSKGATTVTHWKEELPVATKVMVIGAARFAVSRVDSSYYFPVTAWVYPQDSSQGFYDYALGDDILLFFENYIAPYPYKKLANVQSKTIFGGMENSSAIFYAENTVTGTRKSEALMAHEIAHQWFGNTATEKSFAHLWLSEGFATYLTDIYMEQKYGKDSFESRMRSERAEIVDFVRTSKQPVVDSLSNYMDLLNANSYQKGAWFLHMLRQKTGDSTFREIIRAYYKQYRHANADTKDFQAVAEKLYGKSLESFFHQWLYQPGIPDLDMEVKKDKDDLKVKILQRNQVFQFPLTIRVKTGDGVIDHYLDITGKETEFKLKAKGPFEVIIDPEVKMLFDRKK